MLLLALAIPALAHATFSVPRPNGTYGVSLEDKQLIDFSLPDPYHALSHRRVEISIIAPVTHASCWPVNQPYMPTAQSASFWEAYLTSQVGIALNGTNLQPF